MILHCLRQSATQTSIGKRLRRREVLKSYDQNLIEASIILLLISSDFLASDYIFSVELQQALKRHVAGDARVIPIILRPVDWKTLSPLAKLQALPRDAKPVTQWSNRDGAFVDIVQGIRLVCEELLNKSVPDSTISYQRPSVSYHFWEVFLQAGEPTLTFVEREDFG